MEAKTNGNKKKNNKRLKSFLSRPGGTGFKPGKKEKDNPFETIWSRRKFDLLGKKRKGEERRIGLSRSIAIEKVLWLLLPFCSFSLPQIKCNVVPLC